MADVLWLERNVLEALLFKLIEANLILVAEETRFVSQALAEVDEVVARLRGAESRRQSVAADLAADLGVPTEELTLDFLSGQIPEPARFAFEGHRDGFLKLANEIERITLENRRLATRSMQGISQDLDTLLGSVGSVTYTAHGRPVSVKHDPVRLDEVM